MDVIEQARKLGEILQQSDEYIAFQTATRTMEDDAELNEIISQFNLEKVALSQEMQKDDKNQEKVDAHNNKIKDLYAKIMDNANMRAFNSTKEELNRTLSFVNEIILASANGENPYEVTQSTCTGSCGTCGGCH